MIIGSTVVHTLRPMNSVPRLRMIAEEAVNSANYRHFGRYRQGETHCIFKYTLRGSGVFRDGAGDHRIAAGRGFLVEICNPQTAYFYPPDTDEPWHFFYVAFDHPIATAMVREMTERYGAVFSLPKTHPALERLRGLLGPRVRSTTEMSPFQSASVVWNLLGALAATQTKARAEVTWPLLIRRTRQAVAEGWNQNINASELAERMHVSREHLSRRFKQETGMNLHAAIVRARMLHACRMLKDTELPLKDIADHLGYSDPAHFNRTFKRTIGIPPRRFRETGTMPMA